MMSEFAKNGKSSTVVLPSRFQETASMFDQMLSVNAADEADAPSTPSARPL